MKKKYQQFFFWLSILSVIALLIILVMKMLFPSNVISPALPYLVILFFTVTATVHYILLRITTLNPRKFVGYFMLSTTLKLLVYLIVIFFYVFLVREGILAFILSFFILYIIYTIFEVTVILNQTKE
jgi:hypothetical protein